MIHGHFSIPNYAHYFSSSDITPSIKLPFSKPASGHDISAAQLNAFKNLWLMSCVIHVNCNNL